MPFAGGWPVTRFDVIRDAKNDPSISPEKFHEALGYGEAQMITATFQLTDIDDYVHFNSDAAGKLYEEMTNIFHENAVGVRPPEETVKHWGAKMVETQNTYGTLPATMEE
jgi:hypothetical protein